MKDYKCLSVLLVALLMVVAANRRAGALQIVDTNYTAQVYATYAATGIGDSMGMAFDGAGNLYVTQRGDSAVSFANGSIYKITPGGSASRWLENIDFPRRIVWGGGTAYGDNLYVTEGEPDEYILQVTTGGIVTPFARIDRPNDDADTVHPLAIDRSGTYGNLMYTATRGTQRIFAISATGNDSLFSGFPPQPIVGGPLDLAFDPSQNYGGLLYMAIDSDSTNGIYSIDINGNATNFVPSITRAFELEIDEPAGIFGGQMLAYTNVGWNISRIDSQGNIQPLASPDTSMTMTLGPDGALYVAEADTTLDQVTISRITLVPEPTTIALLLTGGFYLRKRKLNK